MWNPWPVSVILSALCRLGSMATVLSFVSCIICQIAYLKYWQKNVFSCRGPWLRAPLKWVNPFPGRWPGQGWPRPMAASPVLLWEMYRELFPTQKTWVSPMSLNLWQSKCQQWRGFHSSSHPLLLCPQLLRRCMAPPKITTGRGREPQSPQTSTCKWISWFSLICFFFFMIGWNLANVSFFTTFSNSDQHFKVLKVLSYTVVFLEYGRAETILNIYHSFGFKEKVHIFLC